MQWGGYFFFLTQNLAKMFKTNTLIIVFVSLFCGLSSGLVAQMGHSNPNMRELPIVLSWDDDGARVTTKTQNYQSTNMIMLFI